VRSAWACSDQSGPLLITAVKSPTPGSSSTDLAAAPATSGTPDDAKTGVKIEGRAAGSVTDSTPASSTSVSGTGTTALTSSAASAVPLKASAATKPAAAKTIPQLVAESSLVQSAKRSAESQTSRAPLEDCLEPLHDAVARSLAAVGRCMMVLHE